METQGDRRVDEGAGGIVLRRYAAACRDVVADWLLNKEDYAAAYDEKRNNVIYATSRRDMALGTTVQSGGDGRPTEHTALRLLAVGRDEEYDQWLRFCNDIEKMLDRRRRILLELRRRYRNGAEGWVTPVQMQYADRLAEETDKDAEECWVESRVTLWRWWEEIVADAAIIAARRGLLG